MSAVRLPVAEMILPACSESYNVFFEKPLNDQEMQEVTRRLIELKVTFEVRGSHKSVRIYAADLGILQTMFCPRLAHTVAVNFRLTLTGVLFCTIWFHGEPDATVLKQFQRAIQALLAGYGVTVSRSESEPMISCSPMPLAWRFVEQRDWARGLAALGLASNWLLD